MGNVSVNHDASRHEHHQQVNNTTNNTTVNEIHHGGGSGGQWVVLGIVALLLGVTAAILGLGLLNKSSTSVAPNPALQTEAPSGLAPSPVVVVNQIQVPVMTQPGATAAPAPTPLAPAQALLTLQTDKIRYTAGEVVTLTVGSTKDGYVRVLYRYANGQTTPVLPNAAHDGRLQAGVPLIWGADNLRYPVPGKADRERILRLRVSGPPFGKEGFVAVFSEQPFADAIPLAAAAAKSQSGYASSRITKQIELEIEEVLKEAPALEQTAEARCEIETRAAP